MPSASASSSALKTVGDVVNLNQSNSNRCNNASNTQPSVTDLVTKSPISTSCSAAAFNLAADDELDKDDELLDFDSFSGFVAGLPGGDADFLWALAYATVSVGANWQNQVNHALNYMPCSKGNGSTAFPFERSLQLD